MTMVEKVLELIPPEDMHYVEEWKAHAEEWLQSTDQRKDDERIAKAMATSVAIARKHDSLRIHLGHKGYEEACKMEDRNVAFMKKCREIGIEI